MTERPVCPQCGTPVEAHWEWCHSCGFDPEGKRAAAESAAGNQPPGTVVGSAFPGADAGAAPSPAGYVPAPSDGPAPFAPPPVPPGLTSPGSSAPGPSGYPPADPGPAGPDPYSPGSYSAGSYGAGSGGPGSSSPLDSFVAPQAASAPASWDQPGAGPSGPAGSAPAGPPGAAPGDAGYGYGHGGPGSPYPGPGASGPSGGPPISSGPQPYGAPPAGDRPPIPGTSALGDSSSSGNQSKILVIALVAVLVLVLGVVAFVKLGSSSDSASQATPTTVDPNAPPLLGALTLGGSGKVTTTTASGPSDGWQTFRAPDGTFTVDFPGQAVPASNGAIERMPLDFDLGYPAQFTPDTPLFEAGYFNIPPGEVADSDNLFDYLDRYYKRYDAKLTKTGTMDLGGGVQGIQYTLYLDNAAPPSAPPDWRGMIVAKSGRGYEVQTSKTDDATLTRFESSLKFLKDPEQHG
jgi:hypothetical protein